MAQTYGRKEDKLVNYRELLPHKSEEDIIQYSKAFWLNYKRLENWDKKIKAIEKGEVEIKKTE